MAGNFINASRRTADFVFYELTRSLCPECKRVIDAQVLLKHNKVVLRKRCPTHGWSEALLDGDAEAYVNSLKYNKPGAIPLEFATQVSQGCPNDCGLCPEHKQHICLALIEVNTGCNLACPTCFADAGPGYSLSLEQVEFMLDRLVRAEGTPEVVQFSGGEPTLHPQLLDMVRMARDKGIRHVMINSNGLRIARDAAWASMMAETKPIIYLQFDGLRDETYLKLRGRPLLKEKLAALDRLGDLDLHTVLVATVERGVNEQEVGAIVRFGIEHPAVRGVSFQPATRVGRHLPFDPADRVTVSEVVHLVQEQTRGVFAKSDFVPVPCGHPSCRSITYAWVDGAEVMPLPRLLNVDDYLDYITNRTLPEPSEQVREALEGLWSASAVPGTDKVGRQFCCAGGEALPAFPRELAKHVFVISIEGFMDAHSYDLKRAMKCCVGVIVPDGRIIPFCNYNSLGYRQEVRASLESGGVSPLLTTGKQCDNASPSCGNG